MANMKALAEYNGPHQVQYLLQPYVLALSGDKTRAVELIRRNHLAESACDDAKQLGSATLEHPLFSVSDKCHNSL
jgi:hypothetical protein